MLPGAGMSATMVLFDRLFRFVAEWFLRPSVDGMSLDAEIPAERAGLPLNAGAGLWLNRLDREPRLFNFTFTTLTHVPGA